MANWLNLRETSRVIRQPDPLDLDLYRCYHIIDLSAGKPMNVRLLIKPISGEEAMRKIFTLQFWFTISDLEKYEFGLEINEDKTKFKPFVFTTYDKYKSACHNGLYIKWEEDCSPFYKNNRLVSDHEISLTDEIEIEYINLNNVISVFVNRQCIGFIFQRELGIPKMIRFGCESLEFMEKVPFEIYHLEGNML